MKFALRGRTLFAILLIGANIFLFERILSQQSFVLLNLTDNFSITKRTLDGVVMGADQYLISRSSVAQGQLHLHRWHGFQEIRTKGAVPRKLRIKGAFDSNGDVDIFWIGKTAIKEGIRIRKENPVMWKNDSHGSWVKTIPFSVTLKKEFNHPVRSFSAYLQKEILPDTGFEISLLFNSERIDIEQNNMLIATIPVSEKPMIWGIQGNGKSVTIDEIMEDETVNNFEAPYNSYVILLLLPLLIVPVFFPSVLFPAYGIFFVFVTLWSIDRFHYSHFQIDTMSAVPDDHLNLLKFEQKRFSLFLEEQTSIQLKRLDIKNPRNIFFAGPVYCDISVCRSVTYPQIPSKKGPRILFVGSSQTIGSGAEKLEDTFFAITHLLLSKKIPGLESLNISESGADPYLMLAYFQSYYPDWKPDYVVINLGFNFNLLNKRYEDPIKEMLKAAAGKEVFIINEAFLSYPLWAGKLLGINRRLANDYHSTIIDLHGFMLGLTSRKEANHWWDDVHFNNLGHFSAGHFIADEISKRLKVRSLEKAHYTDVKP